MLCAVIKGPSLDEACRQIAAVEKSIDLLELRLDELSSLCRERLEEIRAASPLPMIFTLRSRTHGGRYARSEKQRREDMCRLAELAPEYMDIEFDVDAALIESLAAISPTTKFILSYHNFTAMPEGLDALYVDMQKVRACFYKIALMPQNSVDAMRLMCWQKKMGDKAIVIGMGPYGQVCRIVGRVLGCPITYAAVAHDQASAPGQLTVETLLEQYSFRSLTPQTRLYGLIGDPVEQSVGVYTHNHFFATHRLSALYINIRVSPCELADFFYYCRQLPVHGLSVTMPLKESVMSFLDEIDPQARAIGAVNTLVCKGGRVSGFNTDGRGALDALESKLSVRGKRIALLGTGGACKALAYEAVRRGAVVTIIGRDAHKAAQVASKLMCMSAALAHMGEYASAGYDILLNCTSSPLPVDPAHILPECVVMDIATRPKETLLLQHALRKRCVTVYGYQMFVEQAVGQFKLWFQDAFDEHTCRSLLERIALQQINES